jgi:hypothetical protein
VACPSCGTDNDAGARFCRTCGTPLSGTATALAREDADDDDATDPDDVVATSAVVGVRDRAQRTCPNCGASNSARRLLCGRCGADLDSGRVAHVPQRRGPGAPSDPDPDPRTSAVGRTVLAIITAGVIVGAGLGAMVALGVGPFADDPVGPPAAVFDDAAYAGAPIELATTGIEIGASSTHEPVADRSFDPRLMIDGDPTTAWNNSGDTNPTGEGAQIRVEFPEPVWLTRIVFSNGDQRDDARFLGNARVARALVVLDAGVSFTITLLDDQRPQAVRLDVPELTTGLRIEVLEVFPGDTYDDLAVSEIGFHGYVATEEDAELAARRARSPRVIPSET